MEVAKLLKPSKYVLEYYGLINYENCIGLVMEEDVGSVSLSSLLSKDKQSLGIVDSLRIALEIAEGLRQIHEKGIIHQNLRPDHIIVNRNFNPNSSVRFVDFSSSIVYNKITKKKENPKHPRLSPAWISPEQTGRMNKEVDYRTDYYTLGLLLYEMVVGSHPFEGITDESKLVYAHIAKMPNEANKENPKVSQTLSDCISKLLSKNAEERYQSAFGIIYDLKICLNDAISGTIPNEIREVGTKDAKSTSFQLPQKLYGREREANIILESFRKVSSGESSSRLILVSGYSGIGKTSLIRQVCRPFLKDGGYFASGKVDQVNRNLPYAVLMDAFKQLLKSILTESEEKIAYWRNEMEKKLGNRAQIIISVLPEVEMIMGPQPEVAPLGPSATSTRFKSTFCDFMDIFSNDHHPLILFLDDLQWADASTFSLIETVLNRSETKKLLIVGAFRDNEVEASDHPLSAIIKGLQSRTDTITLPNLDVESINAMISGSLNCNLSESEPLSKIVMEKTSGNPFFLGIFLTNLYQEGHLYFETLLGKWAWDNEAVSKLDISDNVVEMMKERIVKLKPETTRLIAIAAAIGNVFDLSLLAKVSENLISKVANLIIPAIKEELIVVVDGQMGFHQEGDETDNKLRFRHNKIQQAAYELLSEESKSVVHHTIGMTLLKTAPMDQLDHKLFEILSHFTLGSQLITDMDDKLALASLFEKASNRAKISSAFGSGFNYAKFGIDLLPIETWNSEFYSLYLELHKLLVECEYLSGKMEDAEKRYPFILSKCRNVKDQVGVYRIKMTQYESQQRFYDCITAGVECIQLHGVQVSLPTQSEEESGSKLMVEKEKVQGIFNGKTVSELYFLKEMKEEWEKDVLQIFAQMWTSCFCIAKKNFLKLISMQTFHFILDHGISEHASVALVNYAFTVDTVEEAKFAYDVAVFGCSLLEKYPNEPLRCRSISPFACGISPRIMPVQQSIPLLISSFESALEVSNYPVACYISHQIVAHQYFKGLDLVQVSQSIKDYLSFVQTHNPVAFGFAVGVTVPFRLLTKDPSYSEEEFLSDPKNGKNPIIVGSYWVGQSQTLGWRSDENWEHQLKVIDMAFVCMAAAICYAEVEAYFHIGISLLKCKETQYWKELSDEKRESYESKLGFAFNFVEKANSVCQTNNQHKLLFLKGMRAKLEGNYLEAVGFFDDSAEEAKNNRFIQYEALANELLGRTWNALGRKRYAQRHIGEALALYEEWGSTLKQEELFVDFPDFFTTERRNKITKQQTTSPTVGRRDSSDDDNDMSPVDVQLMIKMSETISVEMSLEQMLDSMMRLIIENSGAQKGMFLLAGNEAGDDLLLVAEGDVDQMNVNSLRAVPLCSLVNYPHNVINYVVRTKKTVISGDLSKEENLDAGQYARTNHVKSMMCAPIMRNNQFRGVIYLENNLLKDAFSEKRAKSVNIIAVQMIVHLENAKFSSLLESEKRYRILATELETVKKGLEEFIDVLCHELRNPLNGIYGSKQLMADQLQKFRIHFLDNPVKSAENLSVLGHLCELDDMLDAISTSSDHLKDIVDTVLNASRLKQNIEIRNQIFNPKEIVSKVGLMYKAKILEKGLTFNVELPNEDFLAMGDPQRLTQVLVNIVSNSVKFIEKGGVTITCKYLHREDDLLLDFSVKDTGIGMTDEELSKLYKPFSQANTSIRSQYGGSGLGLKISKVILIFETGLFRKVIFKYFHL
eukprot:TRINITY_DN1409_c0_g1_i5.p1 TRINITY_DN1409_c0_g1~~TRINITY_DN1409_c0_g1_i5.p1  ORF type:complete len:1829 (-),score=494.20 TRINITY_DN1409_c0_g1_i5:712-5835(-)